MSQIKTAVSIERSVFEAVDSLAKKIHVSRSHLFEMAAREWVKKEEQKNLTERINQALIKSHTTPDETKEADLMRRHQRKLMEGSW